MNDSNTPAPNQPVKKSGRRISSSTRSSPAPYRSLTGRRVCKNPQFAKKVAHLRLRLSPLVNLRSGKAHPDFPATLLAFWLLTENQLDSLAHFYDQRTPNRYSKEYPCPIQWVEETEECKDDKPAGLIDFDGEGRLVLGPPSEILEVKRRRWGRFMGLRGCESPVRDVDIEARRRFLRERMKRLRKGGRN
ncbi:MAG: hypothetical protein M1814_003360 [Vezdaea aestivalis]|nr:MAG: hypothetical protein M1814_003360 [Vezdaea aestivalis]